MNKTKSKPETNAMHWMCKMHWECIKMQCLSPCLKWRLPRELRWPIGGRASYCSLPASLRDVLENFSHVESTPPRLTSTAIPFRLVVPRKACPLYGFFAVAGPVQIAHDRSARWLLWSATSRHARSFADRSETKLGRTNRLARCTTVVGRDRTISGFISSLHKAARNRLPSRDEPKCSAVTSEGQSMAGTSHRRLQKLCCGSVGRAVR